MGPMLAITRLAQPVEPCLGPVLHLTPEHRHLVGRCTHTHPVDEAVHRMLPPCKMAHLPDLDLLQSGHRLESAAGVDASNREEYVEMHPHRPAYSSNREEYVATLPSARARITRATPSVLSVHP